MVARTRFGFTKYVDLTQYRLAFAKRRKLSEANDLQGEKDYKTDQEILTKRALYFLLREIKRNINNSCDGLRITVIGHSMGAIVSRP